MTDRKGRPLKQNDPIRFFSGRRGTIMPALVVSDQLLGQMLEVKVANDPFTSFVDRKQVELDTRKAGKGKMPTATAKDLRKKAKALDIEGWEDMDRDELAAAIAEAEAEDEDDEEETEDEDDEEGEDEDEEDEDEEEEEAPKSKKASKSTKSSKAPAKKASAKKAPANKKASKKDEKPAKGKKAAKAEKPAKASKKAKEADDEEQEGPNPFRSGSNLWHMTELLMQGGKRSKMVQKLLKKIELNPRTRGGKNFDAAEEIDYRLVRVCQTLTNDYGFTIEKDGRGKDQVVKAIPPEE